ncbi:MAG: UDP-N-acetylmuramoyl-L-alanine--D-glutamate ligase [Bacillota bacterium]
MGSLGSFKDRKVAVVGLGKSNQALTRYLHREGADITCFDLRSEHLLGAVYEELNALGVGWCLGERYLLGLLGFDAVFLTPGMKKNQPMINMVRRHGALITTEIGLFLDRCKARVCGVTGTAGKTTTTTLLGMMLRESLPDRKVYVGGNIGEVLIEKVDSIAEDDLVVLELSSFQLQLTHKSPGVALVLNVRPNHLDIHDSYDEYVDAKKNIYRTQGERDYCILNLDDPVTREMASECPGRTAFFSLSPDAASHQLAAGHPIAWLQGEKLLAGSLPAADPRGSGEATLLAETGEMLVPGRHNVANVLAASLGALMMGATPEGIGRAIRSFKGVEHRIEFVRELRGVRYYNDSKATSPDMTEALLHAVAGPLTLILGGYDKGIPFDGLARTIVAKDCKVVTLGKTAPAIEEALLKAGHERGVSVSSGRTPLIGRAATLQEAVSMAAAESKPGSSVVLSPACASYDMFKDFEERGRVFKALVAELQ